MFTLRKWVISWFINMAKNKRLFFRIDDRTYMLMSELSAMTGVSMSVVARGMLKRCIDELLDDSGNWRKKNAKDKEGKG